MQGALQLAMLEEVRAEPPIRLSAISLEPGSAAQVAAGCARWATWWWRWGRRWRSRTREPPGPRLRRLLLRLGWRRCRRAARRALWPTCCASCRRSPPTPARTTARSARAPTTVPALRDQRRRRVLRAAGPQAAGQAPSVRDANADRGARGRPRDRRAASSGTAASRRSTLPRAPSRRAACGRARVLAGRSRGGRGGASGARCRPSCRRGG